MGENLDDKILRHLDLALKTYRGRFGNGKIREFLLGKDYWPVQSWVNLFDAYGLERKECKEFLKVIGVKMKERKELR